jgi:hypothetical protein
MLQTFIYVESFLFQLIVKDVGPRVTQGLWVHTGGKSREIARCVETARPSKLPNGYDMAFRTCHVGIMAKLVKGSSVYLAIMTAPIDLPVRIFHTHKTAFFGLIKFTGANT